MREPMLTAWQGVAMTRLSPNIGLFSLHNTPYRTLLKSGFLRIGSDSAGIPDMTHDLDSDRKDDALEPESLCRRRAPGAQGGGGSGRRGGPSPDSRLEQTHTRSHARSLYE